MSIPYGAHTLHAPVLHDVPEVNQAGPTKADIELDVKEVSESRVTPSKRGGEEKENFDGNAFTKDNDLRPTKKMRKSHGVDSGIVKGKPLLLDLINEGL